MSLTALLIKATLSSGMYALSAANGVDVGTSIAGNWLSEQLPSVFRSLLPTRLREPNHDLTRAFHAAIQETLIHTTGKQNPIKAFKQEHAAEWGTLHTGLQQAIQQWHADLVAAAKDHEAAGEAPLIEVDDAFLKTLAEDRTGNAVQDVQRQLRAALRERLDKVEKQSDTEADRAAALFIDWFSRQIGAQLSVHFWEQLKTDERARTAYFGLVAESLQQLLGEVAGHAVGMRQDIQQLSREEQERHQAIVTALAIIQQAQAKVLSDLITQGQKRLEQALSVITSQLGRIDQGVQQLLDGHQPPLHHSAPSSPVRGPGVIAISDLDYRQRLIPFQPRPVELDRLDAFLHSPQPFVWWGVVGDGGMGKSRLAQELVQRCRDAGWQAGFLERGGQEWMKTGHRSWQPAFPTLIVLDYASERVAELLPFLAALHERAAELRQPVRVLLLDRPGAVGPLFSDLLEKLSPTTDGHARLAALQALWQPNPSPTPQAISESHLLQLEPPPPSQWSHYFDLILTTLDQPPREWPAQDHEFWQHMRRITHSGRPLYLQMAAIALHFEASSSGDDDLHLTTRTATDLLDAILRHELTTRWPFIIKAHDALDLEPALRRAVGLVTLTRGLDLSDQHQLQMLMTAAAVPAGREEAFQSALCALLHPEAQTQALPPLQPDLLGERYLLLGGATPSAPGPINAFGAPQSLPYFQAEDWLPKALSQRTSKVTEVLSLLLQDFPTHPSLVPMLEAAVFNSLAWIRAAAASLDNSGNHYRQNVLISLTESSLSCFPNLSNLARQGLPLPASLITPLVEAILTQPDPRIQRAIFFPLVLLGDKCRKAPGLLHWVTQYLLPSQQSLIPHLHSPSAILAAQGAVNAIADYGSGGAEHFSAMELWLVILVKIAQDHPKQPQIQLALAKGTVNAIGDYGGQGHFQAMERWLAVLISTAKANDQQTEIQIELANGAVNAIGQYGNSGPEYFPDMQRWLEVLTATSKAHSKLPGIQVALAQGVFNAISHYGNAGLAHFPAMGHWLEVLLATSKANFQQAEIHLQLANGIFNALTHYASGGPEYFSATERWIDVLTATAQAHPKQSEIQLTFASGVFNALINYANNEPKQFLLMERWIYLLAAIPDLGPEVMPRLPSFMRWSLLQIENAARTANNIIPPDYRRIFKALLVLCSRYPHFRMLEDIDGQIITAGQVAAQFLPLEDSAS